MHPTPIPMSIAHQAARIARDYADYMANAPQKREVKPKEELSDTSKAVIAAINSGYNYQGAIIKNTGLTQFAVQSALRRLQKGERIKVEKKVKRGSTWTNIYAEEKAK